MSDELALPSEGRVLDAGCGTGWFTRRLAVLPNLQVIGIDLDLQSLAFARSRDDRSSMGFANAVRHESSLISARVVPRQT